MMNEQERMLCLHRIDNFWWMDGNCLRYLLDYLEDYYPRSYRKEEVFSNEILFAAITTEQLKKNHSLFRFAGLGEKAMLLSFAHPATKEAGCLTIEICSKKAEGFSIINLDLKC